MGKLELYVKNNRGRYELYKEPEVPEEYKQVYRKVGRNKYCACGALYPHDDYLTEGVWVVSKQKSCKQIANGNYLKELYGVDKVSELERIPLAQLGTLHKVIDDVYLHTEVTGGNAYEVFCKRVALIIGQLTDKVK